MAEKQVEMTIIPGYKLVLVPSKKVRTIVVETNGQAEVNVQVVSRKGLGRFKSPSITLTTVDALVTLAMHTKDTTLHIKVTDVSPTDGGVRFGKGCDFSGAKISGISGRDRIVGGEKQPKTTLITLLAKGEFEVSVQ